MLHEIILGALHSTRTLNQKRSKQNMFTVLSATNFEMKVQPSFLKPTYQILKYAGDKIINEELQRLRFVQSYGSC